MGKGRKRRSLAARVFLALVLITGLLTVDIATEGHMVRAAGSEENGPERSKKAQRPLRVWFSSYEQENTALRQIAQKFTQETGVAVEVVSSNFFDVSSKLPNIAETSEKPDIIFMQSTDVGVLAEAGYLKALDFIGEELLTQYDQVGKEGFLYKGNLYGLGYSVDTYGLLYNKALILKPPETWEELFSLAEELTVTDGQSVEQYGLLLNAKSLWFTYPILEEYGGYYLGQNADGSYDVENLGLAEDGMIAGIYKLQELQQKHMVLPESSQSDSHIVSTFSEGRVAMTLYGLWSADIFQGKGVDYGISELPVSKQTGEVSRPLSTVQGFVINQYTELEKEAEAFYTYIYQNENQQYLYEAANGGAEKNGMRNTCNIHVAASDYVASSEILSSLYRVGKSSQVFPNNPEGPLIWNYASTVMNQIFYPEAGQKPDVEGKLTELRDKIAEDIASMHQEMDARNEDTLFYYALGILLVMVLGIMVLISMKKRKRYPYLTKTKKSINLAAWFGLCPFIMLILMFYVYPILHNIYLSLTNYSSMHLRDYEYVGLANYWEIFTRNFEGFAGMFLWTICFAVLVVGGSFVLGVAIAVLLDKIQVTVSKGYRMVFILPWVVPTVITLLMWQGLLDAGEGMVNQILGLFHIPAVPWLTNPVMAKVSSVLVMTWFSFPYYMVVAQGILKSIPRDFYEAARIDGAGDRVCFWKLTLPIVFQRILPTLVMGFIMQFNQFGVYLLTQGGPAAGKLGAPGATDLLITYVFNTAFHTRRYGMAAAYAVIIFIFVAAFTMVSMYVGRRAGKEEA